MTNLLAHADEDADVFDLDLSAIVERGDGHTAAEHNAGYLTQCCPSSLLPTKVTCIRTCGGLTGIPCAC